MNTKVSVFVAMIVGIVIGALAVAMLLPPSDQASDESSEAKPLYWVAPMDSNYRRDKPGKSPMGMDLVPVYAEDSNQSNNDPGIVSISATVMNNLGVRTAIVERKSMQTSIAAVGYVQYDQDQIVHVHPRVEGWIESLFIKAAGDVVKKGAPLYTLYSPQLVNVQEEFLIALQRKNKTLIEASRERLKALHVADHTIEQLQHSGKASQVITFYAPNDGVIEELEIREGFYVTPGTTIMSIAQLEQVWVETEIFERDAASIKQGQEVSMQLGFIPGKTWQGNVDYVYPSLDATTRTLRVRVKFANPDGQLKPNMFAKMTIQMKEDQATLLVPKEAVIRTQEQDRVVLVVDDGQFKSVAVELGGINENYAQILSGLDEGDRVVTSAQFLIDSESSKQSDFQRMGMTSDAKSVWMEGTVKGSDLQNGKVTIRHDPVEAWQWPAMTMDFALDADVDAGQLTEGTLLHFEVTKQDNDFLITTIHIIDSGESDSEANSARVMGVINQIDREQRILNISRDGIEKWGRPPATLDFNVVQDLDLADLNVGMEIEFSFIVDDDFVITAIHSTSNDNDLPNDNKE